MLLFWPTLIVCLIVGTWIVTDRLSKSRARAELAEVAKWKSLPVEERLLAHTVWTEGRIREDANATRNLATIFVAVALGGAFMFNWIGDNALEVKHQAESNCERFRSLVTVLGDNTTAGIRLRQHERDDAADRLGREAGNAFEDIPGYSQLPQAVKDFLNGIVAAQRTNVEEDVASLDSELQRLRGQVDVLRDFTVKLNCRA